MTKEKYASAIGIFFAIFLCLVLTTNVFGLLTFENRSFSLWSLKIGFWLITFLLYLYSILIENSSLLKWKESKRQIKFYLISTVGTIGLILIILTSISVFKNLIGYTTNNEVLNEINKIQKTSIWLFSFSAITAGITEELIFRGYILTRIDYLTQKKWLAIFGSSLIFGLAHYTYEDTTRMLFPFLIGLIFSLHYSKYRSLIAIIICHVIIDFIMI